jgi:dCTP deaminase
MAETILSRCVPGVLSKNQVARLIREGLLTNVQDPKRQVDHSSIDLTVAAEGYEMFSGSLKPFGPRQQGSYRHEILRSPRFARPLQGQDGIYTLKPRRTYVFGIRETLNAARLRNYHVYGQATAKSSVGRVDVLARLIVDGMSSYEEFTPEGLANGNGDMFVEITPMTFPVRVKPGEPLTQLRLFYGEPANAEIRGLDLYKNVLIDEHTEEPDEFLSVDLRPVKIGGIDVSAFRAKYDPSGSPINLWGKNQIDPLAHWDIKEAEVKTGDVHVLKIDKNAFYILRSKQRIRLAPNIAVYCRAIDETIGEMRIHYAGFVHPFFGMNREDKERGTPLIFEVRGHDVNVVLTHRERMARLTFYRMSEQCKPSQNTSDEYNEQELKLSGFFRAWPKKLRRDKQRKLVAVSDKLSRRKT